jgi:peptide/nickel transport system permease protein
LAPRDPISQNLDQDLVAYSSSHPLGTDKLGRDILSRIIYGGRVSLLVGIAAVALSSAIGVAIGSLSGYFGGWVDQLLMRLIDILMAFPGILLAIAFTAVLGPGLDHVVLALCLIGWTGYARLVRGEILALRERDFIHAARALGGSPGRVILRHLLPNLLPPLLIQATFGLAAAIVAEGSLSFLGLGVEPPTPSWGSMLNDGRQFLLVAPHLTTYPGLALMITVLALNLVGDALQDRLDTRNR